MHRSGTPVSNRRCRRGSSHRRTTRCFGYVGRSLPATGLADGTFQDGDGPIVIIAIVPDHVTSVEVDGTILTPTNNIWHRTTAGSTSPRIQNDGLAGLTGGTQISSRRIGRVRRPAVWGTLSVVAARAFCDAWLIVQVVHDAAAPHDAHNVSAVGAWRAPMSGGKASSTGIGVDARPPNARQAGVSDVRLVGRDGGRLR